MSDLRITGPLDTTRYTSLGRPAGPAPTGEDFRETLVQALQETNTLQLDAGRQVTRLTAGEDVDLHEVMISQAEASVAFELMMEIRNKLLEAYQEIQRMNV
jgi:flagellar hook-basal body complex protein FliE